MGKAVLVTGGAGFIGSHVVEHLLKENTRVLCLDNFDPYYDQGLKRENILSFLENENFTLIEGDIRDKKLLESLIEEENVDYIIHEAAQAGVRASVKDPQKVHRVNITGTLRILMAALNSDVKIVNASSSSVYGKVEYLPFDEGHPKNPVSPYGASKLAAEHYCRVFGELYGLRITSLRYFTVYGPRMRPDLAISVFTEKALKNDPIEIFGDGTKTRDFTYIGDAADATLLAMRKGEGGAYNIGGGSRISINELARKIIELTESESEIIHSQNVKGDAVHTLAEVSKAKRELGWKPKISIDEGLRKFVTWFKGL